jgi:hypothetical protein
MSANGGSRPPFTVRFAKWSARHRWPVNEDPNGPQLESEIAFDVYGAGDETPPAERLEPAPVAT